MWFRMCAHPEFPFFNNPLPPNRQDWSHISALCSHPSLTPADWTKSGLWLKKTNTKSRLAGKKKMSFTICYWDIERSGQLSVGSHFVSWCKLDWRPPFRDSYDMPLKKKKKKNPAEESAAWRVGEVWSQWRRLAEIKDYGVPKREVSTDGKGLPWLMLTSEVLFPVSGEVWIHVLPLDS